MILPPSALKKLAGVKMDGIGCSVNPVLFRILNLELNAYTHCGVLDFTAEEDTVILPTNMFNRLYLQEGQIIFVRNTKLDKGKSIKIMPHLTEFIDFPYPQNILENSLRNYFCITEGDTILVKCNNKCYDIDIVECKPKKAICILNCDLEVESPKNYIELRKEETNAIANKVSTINSERRKKLTKQEINQLMQDNKFKGHCVRVEGKRAQRRTLYEWKNRLFM